MTAPAPVAEGASGPLAGVVVVDFSEGIAGPYCTKLLADYGARVVKVEPPSGDPARRMGPYPGDAPDPEASGVFLHCNTNKEGVVIDLARPEGRALARALAVAADVVVESWSPAARAKTGLDAESLLAARPDLVVTSVTGFGCSGPYSTWQSTEIVAFAMGGPMNASGNPDREPVKLVGNVVQLQSGSTAATATLAALYHALESGNGQHVDVATFETQNGSLDRRRYYLLSYEYSGTVGERAAVVGFGRPAAGGRFRAADGLEVTTGRIWPDHVGRMVAVIGDVGLQRLWEEHGADVMEVATDTVNSAIAAWVGRRSARAAMHEAQAGGWPVVTVNDPLRLLADEHLTARNFWRHAEHPVAGRLPYTGPPWRLAGDGWSLRRTAPLLGQDTDRVLTDFLGIDGPRLEALRAGGIVG
jgi:crotonobetainyl-CoA:carnitine CoA-transferase CaiB-like acyl-CoA transferase